MQRISNNTTLQNKLCHTIIDPVNVIPAAPMNAFLKSIIRTVLENVNY
jgi:hypothetical protein